MKAGDYVLLNPILGYDTNGWFKISKISPMGTVSLDSYKFVCNKKVSSNIICVRLQDIYKLVPRDEFERKIEIKSIKRDTKLMRKKLASTDFEIKDILTYKIVPSVDHSINQNPPKDVSECLEHPNGSIHIRDNKKHYPNFYGCDNYKKKEDELIEKLVKVLDCLLKK